MAWYSCYVDLQFCYYFMNISKSKGMIKMSDFNFDAKTRIFSKKNVYGLGRASLLTYKDEEDVNPETSKWGLVTVDL